MDGMGRMNKRKILEGGRVKSKRVGRMGGG